jgi:hypothetical protein
MPTKLTAATNLFPKSNAEGSAATVPKHLVEGRDCCRLRPGRASCVHATARFEAELSGSACLLSPSPPGALARPRRALAAPARAVAAHALPFASAKVAKGEAALDSGRCRRPGGGQHRRRRPVTNRDPRLRGGRRPLDRGPRAPARGLSGAHARGLPHAPGAHARGRTRCRADAATSRLSPVHSLRRGRCCVGVGRRSGAGQHASQGKAGARAPRQPRAARAVYRLGREHRLARALEQYPPGGRGGGRGVA